MQFPKFMPLACAAVLCAGFISARADDNPAQAAARAALDQKMREMDAQQASTNAEASPSVVTPSGATQEQPSPPAAAATTPMADNEAQARALQALQEKMSALDKQEAVETTAASSDNQSQAAARAALDQKMREMDAQQAATNAEVKPVVTFTPYGAAPGQPGRPAETQPAQTAPAAAAPPSPPRPASVNYPGKVLGLKPIAPPPPPVSADKEAQLQALLATYMADKISPEEYQMQRAAILAEP